ncbi:otospiralin-like [Gadus macrocephalus]|uniref:otospiralin-like n=1 Tax=Gadus macrocephalus TaxID=80720 RepID=UPI0028CB786A|nr:otospiralin-like [Gadus macrocephalus]
MRSHHLTSLMFFLLCVCMAIAEEPDEGQVHSSMPYWNLWSSDFFGWVEELRAQGAYDQLNDLARTFWSHFSTANQLGYGRPGADPQPEE